MALLVLRGALQDHAPAWLDSRWVYALQAAAPLVAMLAFARSYRELAVAPGSMAALFASVAVGIGVFLLWVAPMPPWMVVGSASASFHPVATDGTLKWDLIVVRSFGAVLVVPLMEELFWRSFLMRWIDRREFLALAPDRTSWQGVLASTTVFALAHNLWAAGLTAGFAYALLYRRTGNLWFAILAHATTNALLAGWVVYHRAWEYW